MFHKKHARTANGPSDCGSTLCAAIRVSSVSCQGQAAADPCRLACKRVCGYLTRPGHEQAAMFHKKHARTANGPSDCRSTLCAAIRVSSVSCQGQAAADPCRLACRRACGYLTRPGHEQAAMFRKKHARTANGPSSSRRRPVQAGLQKGMRIFF